MNGKLFFRRLADLDWHVHLHIEGQRLPQVLPALQAAPVKLVVDHFGRPDPALGADSEGFAGPAARLRYRPDLGQAVGRLPHRLRSGAARQTLMEVAGPTRLVWGSDCPFTDFSDKVTYQSVLDAFESWLPRAEDRAAVDAASCALYRFDR